jgi:hypothetical protein
MKPPPATKLAELYGAATFQSEFDWKALAAAQQCPFLQQRCLKTRKSNPRISIGTCTVIYRQNPVMICPFRFLEQNQIFLDCIPLLTLHEPENELCLVPDLAVPGGVVDFCLLSVRNGKIRDFVSIELQALDTTGTVWPERQRFLHRYTVPVKRTEITSTTSFAMSWKMTAKTILMQLHHKLIIFEQLSKRFVLVLQDCLLDYMRQVFAFDLVRSAQLDDPMHFHAYELHKQTTSYSLRLKECLSTDAVGVARCLSMRADPRAALAALLQRLEERLSQSMLLGTGSGSVPIPGAAAEETRER